jgi:phosphonopyruvate decarboxylase
LLVEDDVLGQYKRATKTTSAPPTPAYSLSREEAISHIASNLAAADIIVATTGKAGRELFEHREKKTQNHAGDLLVVGGMGHASTIAMAIAQQKPTRKVYCIDGDGALLMHMGSMATIGNKGLKNFYHIVINNGAHESVGGQPTVGFDIDMPAIARACGYKHATRVSDRESLVDSLKAMERIGGPVFIEVRVSNKSRAELSRPTIHPSKNKEEFMTFLNES